MDNVSIVDNKSEGFGGVLSVYLASTQDTSIGLPQAHPIQAVLLKVGYGVGRPGVLPMSKTIFQQVV